MSREASNTPTRFCPVCSTKMPYEWNVSHPDLIDPVDFCLRCGAGVNSKGELVGRSRAEWAEHYDGEILKFPKVEL